MDIHCELEKTQLSIFVDGERWKTGDYTIIGKKPDWSKGCGSMQELEDWYLSLEYKGAKSFALRKLASKNLSSFELSKLLIRKKVSEFNSQKIINEFVHLGYLNDLEWTEAFIKYQTHKKNGPRAILSKLRAKGCHHPGPLLDEISQPKNQQEFILKLISTRYRHRDLTDQYERGKVIAALMRKGYDLDVILQCFSSLF